MLEIDAHSVEEADIVRRQLDAYNARDIVAFMSFWADDAEVFSWPNTLVAAGADDIRARHIERLKEPDLFAELISRVAVGGLVVDREVVTRNFPEGLGKLDVVGIYESGDGRIRRAWFKQGIPVLQATKAATSDDRPKVAKLQSIRKTPGGAGAMHSDG